jgi:hypothetical protein
MSDIIDRINTRLSMDLDNPIVKDIFLSAEREVASLRARVEELQAEVLRMQQLAKY